MPWPRRTHICLNCRQTLIDEAACPCTADQRSSTLLGVDQTHAELVRAVWPGATDPSLVRGPPLRGISGIGVVIALVGYVVLFGARGFLDWQLGVAAVAIVAAGVALAVPRTSFSDLRGRRTLARPEGHIPVGGAYEPRRLGPRSAIEGTVRAGELATSPVSDEQCVAFSLTLENPEAERSPILLRDAATVGFAIETDDGTVAIPPGEVDLIGPSEPADAFKVRLHLAEIDREYESAEGAEPFPFEYANVVLVRAGDRVRLHNPVRASPDATNVISLYRELPSRILVPIGPPSIEII